MVVAILPPRDYQGVDKGIRMIIDRYTDFRQMGLLCLLVTFAACGGGGGGGGGGAEGNSSYGVRALHSSIDGAPVDLVSSAASSPVLTQQVFAGSKGYRSLPDAAQTLSLTRSHAASEVYGSFAVTATSTDRYTILLYGDNSTFGLRTRLIKDEIPASSDGSAAIRIIHGVTQAAEVSVAVGGSPSQLVAFGENTPYLTTPVGAVNVSAVRAVDGAVIRSGSIETKPGKAYTLLLAGELGYYVKSVLFEDS